MKVKYREKVVLDGEEFDIPNNIIAIKLTFASRDFTAIVQWLEEVDE